MAGLLKPALLGLAAVLAAACLQAGELYRWKDADGRLHISSEPPPGEVPVQVHSYQDPPAVTRLAPPPGRPPAAPPAAEAAAVVMYSTAWCGVCKRARRYLNARGIPFREYDVEKSRAARAAFERLGGRGVPIILVGEYRMNGFSEARLADLLARAGIR